MRRVISVRYVSNMRGCFYDRWVMSTRKNCGQCYRKDLAISVFSVATCDGGLRQSCSYSDPAQSFIRPHRRPTSLPPRRPSTVPALRVRAPQSKNAYKSIGGGSPIVTWTNAQADAIAAELHAKGLEGTKCYVGMRYWHPFTEAALEAIEEDEVNALVRRMGEVTVGSTDHPRSWIDETMPGSDIGPRVHHHSASFISSWFHTVPPRVVGTVILQRDRARFA